MTVTISTPAIIDTGRLARAIGEGEALDPWPEVSFDEVAGTVSTEAAITEPEFQAYHDALYDPTTGAELFVDTRGPVDIPTRDAYGIHINEDGGVAIGDDDAEGIPPGTVYFGGSILLNGDMVLDGDGVIRTALTGARVEMTSESAAFLGDAFIFFFHDLYDEFTHAPGAIRAFAFAGVQHRLEILGFGPDGGPTPYITITSYDSASSPSSITLNAERVILAGDTAAETYIELTERTTPPTPGTNKVNIYVRDGSVWAVNDAGTDIDLADTSSGVAIAVEEGDSVVEAALTVLDFGAGFDVGVSPAGEANIALDLSEITVPVTAHDKASHTDTLRSRVISTGELIPDTTARAFGGTAPDRYAYIPFPDAAVNGAAFEFQVPENYASGGDWYIFWVLSGSLSGNVRWEVTSLPRLEDQSMVAAGTTVTTDDPVPSATANRLAISAAVDDGISVAAGRVIRGYIQRNGAHANDTFTGEARLIGIAWAYTASE